MKLNNLKHARTWVLQMLPRPKEGFWNKLFHVPIRDSVYIGVRGILIQNGFDIFLDENNHVSIGQRNAKGEFIGKILYDLKDIEFKTFDFEHGPLKKICN